MISLILFPNYLLADVLLVPDDYPDLKTAVEYADDWDTIIIDDGIYSGFGYEGVIVDDFEHLTIKSKN